MCKTDRHIHMCIVPFSNCRHRKSMLEVLSSSINSSVSKFAVCIVAKRLYAIVMASVLTVFSFGLLPWCLPQVLPCTISLVFSTGAPWNMTAALVVVLATIWKVCSAWHLS